MITLTDRYFTQPAVSYVRDALKLDTSTLLADLSPDEQADIIAAGLAAELPLHYFKRTMPLARVQRVVGMLRALAPTDLLDIGSGRGTFLWPLLDAFPALPVMAIDASEERASLLMAVATGGFPTLTARRADATDFPFADGSFDGVTLLEVLEHIPDAQTALAEAVRVAQRFVLLSVPSKADDNPEHIHLFDATTLGRMAEKAGAASAKFEQVPGHLVGLLTVAGRD